MQGKQAEPGSQPTGDPQRQALTQHLAQEAQEQALESARAGMNDAEADAEDTEAQEARAGFVRRHPVWTLLLVLVIAPLTALAAEVVFLRFTTGPAIVAELHAMSLPTSGLELENWKLPADDGRKEFLAALDLLQTVRNKTGEEALGRLTKALTMEEYHKARERTGPEEFNRLTEKLKPEGFSDNREALEDLFKALEPVRAAMANATSHPDITFGIAYRMGFGADIDKVRLPFTGYQFALVQQARYADRVRKSGSEALQHLRAGLELNDRLRCRTLFEAMLVRQTDRALIREIGTLEHPAAAAALRELAAWLCDPVRVRRCNERLQDALAGELAQMQQVVEQVRPGHSPALSPSWLWSPLLSDLDYRASYERLKRVYVLARQTYPEAAAGLRELDRERLRKYVWYQPQRYFFLLRNVYAGVERSQIDQVAGLTQRLQAAVVCELAADRLEGKDWPRTLDDARFPLDPFTETPFALLVTKEAALIVSPGPDGKDSGLAAQYNKTGAMPNPPFDESGHWTGDNPFKDADDVIFRLPLAPYSAPQ